MKTDKELYRIFAAVPEWLYELAGLLSPGKCALRSVTVKALERRADGVVVPDAHDQPLTIVEFQFQADDRIYLRTVVEMAAVQDIYPERAVQGYNFLKEIEMILLGELPDLEDTASGKDLIRIGEERGEKRGFEKAIVAFLVARYGTLPAAVQEGIAKLTPAEAEHMMQFLAECQSLDEVAQWLAGEKSGVTP